VTKKPDHTPLEVNVKKILSSKSPKLARWIPPFIVGYLRRIVHEEELNSFLRDFADLSPIDFARATLGRIGIAYHAEGMEKLDPKGRYLLASNHPFGSLDGLILADEVNQYFGDVRLIVNDLLMYLDPLKALFIPVNKHGPQNSSYARQHSDAFDSAIPIITFPAGLCSRRIRGEVRDLPWKPGFVRRAIASQRDIVPVYFDGRLSRFFYNLANVRKKSGVKSNFEMLYLADEMFKLKGNHCTIRIGEPVPWQEVADGRPAAEWAKILYDRVYDMRMEN